MTMRIDYTILKKLLDCNKNIKLNFIEGTNTLDIKINNQVIKNIELISNNIEDNSDIIYNTIVKLENVTIYIPKIYIKE